MGLGDATLRTVEALGNDVSALAAANPNLAAWLDRVLARPAVQKGLTIPEPFPEEKHMEAFFSATVGVGTLHDA